MMGWFTLWSLASEGSVWIIWWLTTLFPCFFLIFPNAHSERISKEGQKEGNGVHKALFFSCIPVWRHQLTEPSEKSCHLLSQETL